MIYLQQFTQFINENQEQPEPNEVSLQKFETDVIEQILCRSEEFTPLEEGTLRVLFRYLDQEETGNLFQDSKSRYDRRLKIVKIDNPNIPSAIWIGKKKDNTWSMETNDIGNGETQSSVVLGHKFYIFPDMKTMVEFIRTKFGPIEWIRVK
jgi:hypothetical protein